MKIVLTAVNAKYSHTNLAVRYLFHALQQAGLACEIAEFTINQPVQELLAALAARCAGEQSPYLLLSCYLWNISLIEKLGADFRLLFPHAKILLGGPEVSFDAEELLHKYTWADAILCGEGEYLLPQVMQEVSPQGVYHAAEFVNLDELSFPYDDLAALNHRVLYYESSRGCPFGCSYCLSAADRKVRTRSLPLVFSDLKRFLDAGVMRVKFVDRTFNLDGARAMAIWQYIKENDNGVTSFQMELGGDLLTGEQTAFLSSLRPGLVQFEIGVQSTCAETLRQICRVTDLEKLTKNVAAVKAGKNIHQHLDLIAGLPGEGFSRFAKSYDDVFAMRPEQLQLGFLKLLRGSPLYSLREKYGLVHSANPPYEILQSDALSFGELCRLKAVEEMTEWYYNSGRFANQLALILKRERSPFSFFLALGEQMPKENVGKYERYDLLYDFAVQRGTDAALLGWNMRLDLCLHERPRKLPARCPQSLAPRYKKELAALQLTAQQHAEIFPFDLSAPDCPRHPMIAIFTYPKKGPAAVLFQPLL